MASHSASTNTQTDMVPPSKVLIVGAGIGGLFLALLLDKAGIDYEIYERSPESQTLGSVLSLNVNILPAFEQIGLYEELLALSARTDALRFMYDDLRTVASLSLENLKEEVGYDCLLLSRSMLYQLLKSKVPTGKIHFGKKVVSSEQNNEEVTIMCEDGTRYCGSILVGADGINSGVRKQMYSQLKKENKLPSTDSEEQDKGYVCLMGTTSPLDAEEYPFVESKNAVYNHIVGGGSNFSWSEFNVGEKRVCWIVVLQQTSLSPAEAKRLRNSEWSTNVSEETLDVIKNLRVPGGRSIGDLVVSTPDGEVCRVFLEDQVYETWYHGRTVLIGDAAHKLLSSAGQGAVTALQDALILANCLYDLSSQSPESIQNAFQSYKTQRIPHVKEEGAANRTNALFLHGQTLWERTVRYLAIHLVPQSVKHSFILKGASYRPQIAFLPQTPKRGSGHVLPQQPSKRYEAQQQKTKYSDAAIAATIAPEAEHAPTVTAVV
ncbi:hypothetical protein EMPS_10876 [Entomortierella parvispora]|uniref:FAD-binding domain-containing protein n=1 Tax=Entomortierella parvispora TaxID=205924 RepID=A0A9P3M1R8_9FUNG|nr:hypothetical protein EMPS_10876 [Entomortierella parvispora]